MAYDMSRTSFEIYQLFLYNSFNVRRFDFAAFRHTLGLSLPFKAPLRPLWLPGRLSP